MIVTYQRYPVKSGVGSQLVTAQHPAQPPSLRYAVRLMWAGAGLAMVGTILTLAVSSKVRSGILNTLIKNSSIARRQGRIGYTLPQLHTWAHGIVVAFIVGEFISVLLWAWMGWANNRGRNWARITASSLFALITVQVLRSLSWTSVSFLFMVLEWLIGLVAVVLLWRRETTLYIGTD
jgi:hypothetical protein